MYIIWGFQFNSNFKLSIFEEFLQRMLERDPLLSMRYIEGPFDLSYWVQCKFNASDLISVNLEVKTDADLDLLTSRSH